MVYHAQNVDPRKFPDETFNLYSIPAFDSGMPVTIDGSDIGSAKQLVQPGDVLLSRIVPHIRRAWIVRGDGANALLASGEWIVFRSARIDSGYLRHLLVSDRFHAQFMATVAGVGGSLMRARPAFVARIKIVLPPLDEQRRIARVLDTANVVRANRRATLSKQDMLSAAVFLEAFGDPLTNPRRWPLVTLGELFSERPMYGTMIPASADSGRWLCLRVANINGWNLDLVQRKYVDLPPSESGRHEVRDGDLLLARAIASENHLGKAVLVEPGPREWAFDSHLMRLRFDRALAKPRFIREFLRSSGGRARFMRVTRRSAVQFNVNTKEIADLEIPCPPIELQSEFVARQSLVVGARDRAEAHLAHLDALFASLQHRAFTGAL